MRLRFSISVRDLRRLAAVLAVGGVLGLLGMASRADTLPATAPTNPGSPNQAAVPGQQQLQDMIDRANRDLPALLKDAAHLDPLSQFMLSRRLLPTDPAAAMEWLVVARLHLSYDTARCTDPSVGGGGAFLAGQWGADVATYAHRHPAQYLAALKRVQVRTDLFASDASSAWICGSGISAYGQSLGVQTAEPKPAVKPASEWPAIEAKLRQELTQAIDKLTQQFAAAPPHDYLPEASPTEVPAVMLSGSREERIATIGAEARRAALIAATESPSTETFRPIAKAQVDGGDLAGARETLSEAVRVFTATGASTDGYRGLTARDELIGLLVKAGNPGAARGLAELVADPTWRLAALGTYAEALAAAGDTAGARGVFDEIEGAAAAVGNNSGVATAKFGANPRGGPNPELALRAIVGALADAGDFAGALNGAARLPNGVRELLVAQVAGKRCAVHDLSATGTLRLAATSRPSGSADLYGTELVYAYASCGDMDGALATAGRLSDNRRGSALNEVVRRLMERGQYPEAAAIDRATLGDTTTAEDWAALAARQVERGDEAGARASVAKAYELMRPAAEAARETFHQKNLIAVIQQPVASVVDTQVKLAAYDDAFATAELEDQPGRPQYLLRIIGGAASRHDDAAVRRALPRVVQDLDGMFGAGQAYLRLGKVLAHAGYRDEAGDFLTRSQNLDPRRCQQGLCWEFVLAKLAMGDVAAARELLRAEEQDPGQRDKSLAGFVRELVTPENFSGASSFRRERRAFAPDVAANLPVAAEMAWQIQEPSLRAQAMLLLLEAQRG